MEQIGLELPSYSPVIFPAAALELCIVQIRFPVIPRFNEEGYLTSVQESLMMDYPLATVEQITNLTPTPQGLVPTPAGRALRFITVDHAWSIVLTSEVASIEARQYGNVGELSHRVTDALGHIARHLQPRLQLRFGMRYINEFRIEGGESYATWRTLLNPELLGYSARNILGGTVEQTVGELRTRLHDGTLIVRHGFLQGTTVLHGGQKTPKNGPFYLLDMDYFNETPSDFDANPVDRIQTYNDFMYRIFRWAIGEGTLYRRLLGDQT